MRAFCTRLILFLLLQGLLLFTLVWTPRLPEENNYLAATIDKHRRLHRTPPPRLILVGGSNVAFGFDSERLAEDLKLPVVNMGLVGGLGVDFMLSEVEEAIDTGDVVVLSFEYDLLGGGDSEMIFRQIIELRPQSFRFIPWRSWKRLITDHGAGILGGIVRNSLAMDRPAGEAAETFEETAYQRRHFDPAGGYIGHHGSDLDLSRIESDRQLRGSMPVRPMSEAVHRKLVEFARLCASRGAKCFYTCPPHPKELLDPKRDVIRDIWKRLGTIEGLTLLDDPDEQIYPLSEFYDTGYHLTRTGALARTAKVAEKIKSALEDQP